MSDFITEWSVVSHGRSATRMAFRQHIDLQNIRLVVPGSWHRHLCQHCRPKPLWYQRALYQSNECHLRPRRLRCSTSHSDVQSDNTAAVQGAQRHCSASPSERLCRHVRRTVVTGERHRDAWPRCRRPASGRRSAADRRAAPLPPPAQRVRRGDRRSTMVHGGGRPTASHPTGQVQVIDVRPLARRAAVTAGAGRPFTLVSLHSNLSLADDWTPRQYRLIYALYCPASMGHASNHVLATCFRIWHTANRISFYELRL